MQEYNKTKEEENKSIFQTKDVSLLSSPWFLGKLTNYDTLQWVSSKPSTSSDIHFVFLQWNAKW